MDSPSRLDLSIIDSTSELLQGLDLIETNNNSKNMDNMDADRALEVPDTPDRLAMRHMEVDLEKDAGPSSSTVPLRKTYHRRSDRRCAHHEGSSANALDTESLFERARKASLLSKSLEPRPSLCTQRARPGPQSVSVSIDGPSSSCAQGRADKSGRMVDASLKFPLNICYPTRCRNGRRKVGNYLQVEGDTFPSDALIDVGSSPTEPIRRTRNGIQNSLHVSTGICEADKAIRLDGPNLGLNGQDERIDLINGSEPKIEKVLSRPLHSDAPPNDSAQRSPAYIDCVSPLDASKGNIISIDGETDFSSGRDKGKGSDLSDNSQIKSEQAPSPLLMFDVPRKTTCHRRLVRNGCISPLNIARGKAAESKIGNGIHKFSVKEHSDSVSSCQSHSANSGGSQYNKAKGKDILDEIVQENGRYAKSRSQSRVCPVPGKDAGQIVYDNSSTQEAGWRSTHNHTEKVALLSIHDTANVSRGRKDVRHLSDQCRVNADIESFRTMAPSSFSHGSKHGPVHASPNVITVSEPENERRRVAQRFTKGKRKCSSHTGECSSTTSDLIQASNPRTSGQPSNAKSTRTRGSQHCGIRLGPIIDVDELPTPELRCGNPQDDCRDADESSERALQVESDEILARQLQEQFFNESPGLGGAEEIDANLAWTLQQEDSQRASFIGSQLQSYPRGTSIAHLYRHYPRQTFDNSSARSTNHARVSSSARMARLRRNLNRHEVDIEMRLNILEALETAFDNSNDATMSNHILQLQRDFNENDYEMLLALDDDNHQHIGASFHQINSLPQSVVETENIEEACAVCLETPSIGDTIRHLPCLHKFHKECIDTWLRRKTSCPICKSGIT